MLQKFDERNRDLIVNINGQLMHRDKAGISPFDSAVQGGDAVWEGLRLYDGRIFKLHEHLDRLERSARALSFAEIPSREKIVEEFLPKDGEGKYAPEQVAGAFEALEERVVRDLILEGKRIDGRSPRQLRQINCEVGVLPRTHGTAIFSRGETITVRPSARASRTTSWPRGACMCPVSSTTPMILRP